MIGSGFYQSSTRADVNVFFPVQMRVNPTLVQSTGTNYYYVVYNNTADFFDAWTGITSVAKNGTFLYVTSGVAGAAGAGTTAVSNSASSSIAFDSEL